ncbi:SGNH/GDSL hydrolase family protein [Marinobacter sp.]|uniref:SGNH/GDSL hydrolase family protein n=1 Tax=Marinobacter sp. TaxID=50741 RepID=UPI0034A5A041
MNECIAYGDCNTEGLEGYHEPVWAELVAGHFGLDLVNCGHTMSTTRELIRYAQAFPPAHYQVAFIQYGLVDSWLVFRGAPYVLYYPDNPFRKFARKLVKKLKKVGRSLNLLKRLGAVSQVPLQEYITNIERVILCAPQTRFVLVATPPNLDEPRNPGIETYNQALHDLAARHANAVVADAYGQLWRHRSECLMSDGTHLSAQGHRVMSQAVIAALNESVEPAVDKTVPSQ